MKEGIHPKYGKSQVRCGCGHTFETCSTIPEIAVEICSSCHPFFTGQQKFVDTMGRVQRFQTKFGGEYFKKSSSKPSSLKPRT
jgi:large subunit ribosomal protein L31